MPDRPCTNRHHHPPHYRDEPGQPTNGAWCPGVPLDRRREWAAAYHQAAADVTEWAGTDANPDTIAGSLHGTARRIELGLLTPWADGAKQATPRPQGHAAAPEGRGASTGTPTAQEGAQAVTVRGVEVWRPDWTQCADPDRPIRIRVASAAYADLADSEAAQVAGALQANLERLDDTPGKTASDLARVGCVHTAERDAARDQLQHEQDQTALAHAQLAEQQRELDRLRAYAEAADNALADTRHQLDRLRAELDQIHAILDRHRIGTRGAQGVLDLAGRLEDAYDEVAAQRTTINMVASRLALRQDEADQARAELERARPVVEAARAVRADMGDRTDYAPVILNLAAAVDQHQQQDR